MTETRTARMELPQWSAGTDGFSRLDFNEAFAKLENWAARDEQGTRDTRPAPGVRGRYYTVVGDGNAALNGTVYRDNGTSWDVVGARVEQGNFRPAAASGPAVTMTGLASQTGHLMEWFSSVGTSLGRITAAGAVVVPGAGSGFGVGAVAGSSLAASSTGPTVVALLARSFAGQTADIQQWQTSDGTVLARVDKDGKATFKGLASSVDFSVAGDTVLTDDLTVGGITNTKRLIATAGAAGQVPITVKGFAGQTAALWQALNNADAVQAYLSNEGEFWSKRAGVNDDSGSAMHGITAEAATDRGQIIKGASSQSANLSEWRSSADAVMARVNSAGQLMTPAVLFQGFTAPNSSSAPTQYPPGVTHSTISSQTGYPKAAGLLETINNESTQCKQRFYDFASDRSWSRTYSGGGWTPWREIMSGSVAAKMVALSAVNIPDGGMIPFFFDTIRYETHAGMCTLTNGSEKITVPTGEDGLYRVTAQLTHSAATGGTNSYRSCGIQVNGTSKNRMSLVPDPGTNSLYTITLTEWTGYLAAGDEVRVETFQFTGSATLTAVSFGVADTNYLGLHKVGPPLT